MPIPVKQPAPKKEPVKMKIYHTLCEWITYGTLQPGERLNDQEICEYFDVSRTPVREALQMLASQRLIEIYPNKGTVVSEIEAEHKEKWYLPLANLQSLAAELACQVITPAQLDELAALDAQVKRSIQQGNIVATLHTDLMLHNRILDIADKEFIREFSGTLMLHIQRMEFALLQDSGLGPDSFASHGKLIDALRRRDAATASSEMKQNWLVSLERASRIRAIR